MWIMEVPPPRSWNSLGFMYELMVVVLFQAGKVVIRRRVLIANNRRFGVCDSFVEGASEPQSSDM